MDRPSYNQRNSINRFNRNNNTFTPMVATENITPVINLLKVVFDIEPLEKYVDIRNVDIRNVNFNDDSNDQDRDSK